MTSSDTLTIDTAEKAGRYLSGLGGSLGFDEAVRRVESRSSSEIRAELAALARWIRGESSARPGPAFSLIGTVVREAPPGGDIGKAIGSADLARADARAIADHVRSSMLNGIPYLALLLIVAAIVALTWLVEIGPQFRTLYSQMEVALPWLSRVLVDQPLIVPAAIGLLAILLAGVVVAANRLKRSIEAVTPLGQGLVERILGPSLRRAHDNWCVLSLSRAWSAAGEDPAAATRRAAQVLGAEPQLAARLEAEMQLAAELGAAGNELAYLAETSAASYRDALEVWRAVGLRALQIAIAIVVGLIIVAIYLPIFKMGAIV